MTIRRVVWQWHWGSGVFVGLVVAIMAVSGMALAMKPFVLSWVDTPPVVAKVTTALPIETVLAVHGVTDDQVGASVTRYRSPQAPLRISKKKGAAAQWVNPYSSAAMGQESPWGGRFETLESWHRWLGLTGLPRDIVRVVKAVACVWLMALVLTGVWLATPWRSRRSKPASLTWHRWVGNIASPFVMTMAITGIWLATEPVKTPAKTGNDQVQQGGRGFPFEVAQQGIAKALPEWTQFTFRLGPHVSAMVQQNRLQRTLVTFDESGHIQRMTPRSNWPKWIHTGEWAGQSGAILSWVTAGCVLLLWLTGMRMVWVIQRKKR